MQLVSSREIAKSSAEALLKLLASNHCKTSPSVERRIVSELVDESRKTIANRTIQAAIEGRNFLAVTDIQLDTEWLEFLGFECINATKRLPYQSWLEDSIDKDSKELLRRADALLMSCHSLKHVADHEFHYRNPILSLMESLWRSKKLSSESDLRFLIETINSEPNVNNALGDEHVSSIQIILTLFLRGKLNETEHETVSWLNSCIPKEAQSCQIVTWRRASDKIGSEVAFSAKTASWYSVNWQTLIECLNEHLAVCAKSGNFSIDIRLSLDDGEWSIEKYDEGFFSKSVRSLSPLLLIDELKMSGFGAQVILWTDDGPESFPTEEELKLPISRSYDYSYYLRVNWGTDVV